MTTPASGDRVTPHPSVVFTELDDTQSALLHLETKRYYSLNETGTRIWQLLAAGLDRAAVGETLSREFEVSAADAERSVAELVDELVAEGLAQR